MGLFNSIRLGSSGAGGYEVERSLRFYNADNTRIQRAIGSTSNRRTFTYSFWIKRTVNSTEQYFFYNGPTSSTPYFDARFEQDSHELQIADYTGSSRPIQFITNRKFRDPNAWYHIVVAVDTTQSTESDRFKLYVNGVQETSFSTSTYPSQDYDSSVNVSGHIQGWGTNQEGTSNDYDGYLAEVHFIDGLQLTPSSFAETDAITGEWKPKKYAGAYGTNGNHLTFSDNSNTTATTLGKDSSGNGNNFTPHNFVTGDSVKDSPTNNFATLRLYGTPAESGAGLTQGNLEFTSGASGSGSAGNRLPFNTIIPTSGKWYVEVMPTTTNLIFVGVHPYQVEIVPSSDTTRWQGLYSYNGESYLASTSSTASNSTHAASYGNEDVIGVYINMDASTPEVYFSKNGQWANGSGSWNQSSPTSAIALGGSFFTTSTGGLEGIGISIRSASSSSSVSAQVNFGQDSTFAGRITAGGNTDANAIGDFKYTVPTNALALCTANLTDPTIAEGNKHFDTLLWTGNSTDNRAITGLNFQPDFTWIKRRSGGGMSHFVVDSLRSNTDSGGGNGNDGPLATNSNATEAAQTDGGFESFNSDGFTLGKGSSTANADAPYQRNNASGETYVGWSWKGGGSGSSNGDGSITSSVSANTSAGFSILTYTGTGSQTTVGHGLGVAPKVIITKIRDTNTQDWMLYPKQLTGNGATYIKFNATNDVASDAHTYPDVEPTSTVYTVGGDDGGDGTNGNGKAYVAYCFSEVAGFSKFGLYTGNGNADGTFVYTGFKPALVIIKRLEAGYSWYMIDNKRDPINPVHENLYANDSIATYDYTVGDFLSNGFKLRNTGSDTNQADSHIFLAFAESPFKYSRAR